MRVGLISDLHYKTYKKSNSFLRYVEQAVENFYEIAEKQNVDEVFILGDVFQMKDRIEVQSLQKALRSLRKVMRRWPTKVITGNHDVLLYENNSINSLEVFDSDCEVITDYRRYVPQGVGESVFHFMPFFKDDILREKMASIEMDPQRHNVLLCHVAVKSMQISEGHEDVWSDIELDDIRGDEFNQIFSGHVHHHSTTGNFTYVSSPLESHFGEGGDHGYVFFDSANPRQFEFVRNEKSPRFVSIELNKGNAGKILALKNTFVNLVVKKNVDRRVLEKLMTTLRKSNPFVNYEYDIAEGAKKIAVVDGWDSFVHADEEQILDSYVDALSSKTDEEKSELKKYISAMNGE